MNDSKTAFLEAYKHLRKAVLPFAKKTDFEQLKQLYVKFYPSMNDRDYRLMIKNFHVAAISVQEIGLGHSAVVAILLFRLVLEEKMTIQEVEKSFNKDIFVMIKGLIQVNDLYKKTTSIETENFRRLLLTFAEDIRVIFIKLASRLYVMRELKSYSVELQDEIARETSFLYAPMAHRLGLYSIKTELEDLSLKYTQADTYREIAEKLNETKRSREEYIEQFIAPLKQKIGDVGFDFEIKGRTKSIYSIWNKIKKQNTPFENIYDLFAIRIILNSELPKEKAECWQVYSIVADMYQPNPKRLRDWLSIPKTNGYESLHTTVMGPQGKWVEVQIRTKRMDEIAEKGLAAHWKYKGIKSETGMDEWLKNIREILENPELNAINFMDEFKLNLYDKEVFVFTPTGDLQKLPKGATLLDFAFHIHTELGSKCVGGKANGKNVTLKYVLNNGDQIDVQTSSAQKPKLSWLQSVTTSRAKTKIRQAVKDEEYKDAQMGREILQRRFKNWKIEPDESKIGRLAKKKGFKTVSDFYQELAQEKLDILALRELYLELDKKDNADPQHDYRSAENFVQENSLQEITKKEDVLIIDQNLRGIEYSLAKCCNPIFGDEVFGFITTSGGFKIHKKSCPNAPQMISRFAYRIIPARWSGKSAGAQYAISLAVVGIDDIGIVTNISSLLSKEKNITLRSISVNSHDGLFEGQLTLMVSHLEELENIIKKIRTVKGVKSIRRM
ncbi:MAG: bifunctional (p)ppGpp synthetase/guanosine-3',5'-bis(diphosphate) 3'-pyrophosphohydrolase [Paludibacteraceae bacterium]|nr:bifunctional (p)ppGpp synthetase/guanosine-3',5'-bis(diphosphate) 3'-pyrophosphohydrolase [Paludibacteraceae bacterium]